jgi:hypothetical protein
MSPGSAPPVNVMDVVVAPAALGVVNGAGGVLAQRSSDSNARTVRTNRGTTVLSPLRLRMRSRASRSPVRLASSENRSAIETGVPTG